MTQASQGHILHQRRRTGILLHPTSLPGPAAHGLLCHDAYRFVEWLAQAGVTLWQSLPLGPTHKDGSPYNALSAHAGETALLSLDWFRDRGLLKSLPESYDSQSHTHCLYTAWKAFHNSATSLQADYDDFLVKQRPWLDDYALFMAIREQHNSLAWTKWPAPLRNRDSTAMSRFAEQHANLLDYHRFTQFVFFRQWLDLKAYANTRNVLLFGDMPIYVALDSVDVWANRKLFTLDASGEPVYVAGVPPDYFSETGQRWGNPQYDWSAMQRDSFHWWQQRLRTQLELFDVIRIDHFRGFQAYWEIRAQEKTAMHGRWVEAPGAALLQTLHDNLGSLPLVAEDLGVITDEVTALRKQFALPGMKILQFAFDGDPANSYLPHNHEFNSVVYTGTHDNDTSVSWYAHLDKGQRDYLQRYLDIPENEHMPWPLVRSALASTACLAMLPMQDILGLGEGHRMNTPGTSIGNWQWRFDWTQVPVDLPQRLYAINRLYDRVG